MCTGQMWLLLNTYNMATATKELNFKLWFIQTQIATVTSVWHI